MLAVVGHPTACNPDFRLRSTARSYDWPVLDLSEDSARSVERRPQGFASTRTYRSLGRRSNGHKTESEKD